MNKIKPEENGFVNVIIETPRGSCSKYDSDFELETFKLDKVLPLGMEFPFDFGFVPNTKGEDGDPLDVLVMMDEAGFAGCLVVCRIVGVLEALQTEGDGKQMRNDRIIAVASVSNLYEKIDGIASLGENILNGIESFFINYNKLAGKEFKPLGWHDATAALKLISKNALNTHVF
ncbi:MAG: inorganic diphosphatase [Flavipsychrobacter sp.]|nr:inorganic diphosphatase [Flavipsychrobacter sp.]